jgi:hypothetical protein
MASASGLAAIQALAGLAEEIARSMPKKTPGVGARGNVPGASLSPDCGCSGKRGFLYEIQLSGVAANDTPTGWKVVIFQCEAACSILKTARDTYGDWEGGGDIRYIGVLDVIPIDSERAKNLKQSDIERVIQPSQRRVPRQPNP